MEWLENLLRSSNQNSCSLCFTRHAGIISPLDKYACAVARTQHREAIAVFASQVALTGAQYIWVIVHH
jgi:hypothetical protein